MLVGLTAGRIKRKAMAHMHMRAQWINLNRNALGLFCILDPITFINIV